MKQILLIAITMAFLASAGTCGEVRYDAQFTWTAVGDNDTSGLADHYEIYYSTDSMNVANFTGVLFTLDSLPTPSPSGTLESYSTQLILGDDRTYWFRLRVYDEVENYSESNMVPIITPDRTKPGPVTLQINFIEL